jgi:hypothetical protein
MSDFRQSAYMLSRYRSGDPQPADIVSLVVVRRAFWAGFADTVEHLCEPPRRRSTVHARSTAQIGSRTQVISTRHPQRASQGLTNAADAQQKIAFP